MANSTTHTPAILAASLSLLLASAATSQAESLFRAESLNLRGDSLVDAESDNFLDLVSDLVKSQADFDKLDGQDTFSDLDYAGLEKAFQFERAADGTRVRLRIPITGLDRTFTGSSKEAVEDALVDFLKKNGQGEYEKFLRALNGNSKASPVDGNPASATARLASASFEEFGIESSAGASLLAWEASRFSAGKFDGDAYTLPLAHTFMKGKPVSVQVKLPMTYMVIEGAEVYNIGLSISVPWRILDPKEGSNWSWRVTPTVGAIVTGSEDFAVGAAIGQLALTNYVGYNFGKFTLGLGSHVSFLEGIPVKVEDYDIGGGVSQIIVKNGLSLSVPVGEKFRVTAYGIYSQFLNDAAVGDYFTFGGEVGYRPIADRALELKLGVFGDVGSDYSAASVRVGSAWKF